MRSFPHSLFDLLRRSCLLVFIFVAATLSLKAQPEPARLLRFPAIHGDQVVFTYAGDLYTVPKQGGTARRLTQHPGFEMFARFSPDGSQLAFTGQYDGNTEVFLMPATGGQPQRLTYTATLSRDQVYDRMGPNNLVMGWKDDQTVVFRSRMRSFNSFKGHLFRVDTQGNLPEQLPLAVGSWISFEPGGGSRIAFNQVFREFRTWKYYQGGMADDIWLYDFESEELTNLTQNDAQDIFPMWQGDKVYFLSDRDRTMNLFSYDLETQETKKETDFTEFDIKFPSLGDAAIIFENGGYLYTFDLATGATERLDISLQNDFPASRDELVAAGKFLQGAAVSPAGHRVALNARGEVFSVPAKEGVTRNLSRSPGARERDLAYSPDGKYLAYLSDASGTDEIYLMPTEGEGEPVQLTEGADTYYRGLSWSPDSKHLLFSDRKLRLRYVSVENKEITLVEQGDAELFSPSGYSWSPDSRWIAFARPEWQSSTRIYLHEIATGTNTPVTESWYDASDPTFSPDGKYLFFASSRDFSPIYSNTEWNHAYVDMEKVYLLTLAKVTASPLAPTNDEVEVEETEEEKEEEKEEASEKPKKPGKSAPAAQADEPITVDLDGISRRILSLPIDAGNYRSLSATEGAVYYVGSKYREPGHLKRFDLKGKKEKDLGRISGYQLSANGKKMLVFAPGRKLAVISLPRQPVKLEQTLDLSGLQVKVDKRAEWRQIFEECHRQYQWFFYAPNMHGVDWEAIKEKYRPLLPYVQHRADLTYIIGEMIGELNVGHAYVGDGDVPELERIDLGLLGAELSKHESGFFQIDHILPGANWDAGKRSPLTEIGVEVSEGDFILAINGESVEDMPNLFAALTGKAGQLIELTINDEPSFEGSHPELIKPLDDESELYYYQWVQENIRKVSEATGGQVGYIHIPDMGPGGLNEFVKHFYPQLNKKALIIDDRGNGGGNVSPMIIERLARELVMTNYTRDMRPGTNPYQMLYGPKVLLMDQYSASDGDLFPYRFKKMELGPVIGRRSWGGVIGYRGTYPLVDGGYLVRPEFGPYDIEGKEWIIEGTGVEPDITVYNDPAAEYRGEDAQLQRAIEEVLKLLEAEGKELAPVPPFPERNE